MPRAHVHTVRHLPPPFIGMNGYAAKALGMPWRFGKDDVVVVAGLSSVLRRATVRHEMGEAKRMKRGQGYFAADAASPRLTA